MKKIWRIWAKALGDKSGKNDKEADFVAMIRTFIFLQLIITNCFIVGGNIVISFALVQIILMKLNARESS